jgi:hypothetical protein
VLEIIFHGDRSSTCTLLIQKSPCLIKYTVEQINRSMTRNYNFRSNYQLSICFS